MAISRAQLAKELEPGLNALFGLEYDENNEEYKEIYSIEDSDRAFEEEVLVVGFGAAPVKEEGAGVSFDNASEGYTARYTHETVALAFSLTEEAIEDNLYDQLGRRYTKALARSMQHTKEVKGANVLNNAFDANFAIGDGQQLISTAHPLAGGGTARNRATTMADLNETSLEDNIIDISTFVDDRNLTIAVRPDKLIIPPQLSFIADRLLNTPGRVGTADNDINSINDPDAYFIMTSVNADGEGLKMFNRTGMETSMEPEFSTGNIRYRARERYSFGVSNWRGVFGSQGA
jgi:hypothetical protein